CHPIDSSENIDVDHHAFWREMEIETTSDGPKYTELEKVMDFSKTWSEEKRMMVGRLMLLSVAIHGIHHGSRIPLSSAKRVFDPDGFEKHPWCRVAFTCLVNSVKIVDLDKDSYTVQGCVHALLIWLYESVPGIGKLYGLRRSTGTGIPLLDWQSTRKGIKMNELIKDEYSKHGQVRVKHMVDVSEDHMYPEWSDDEENKDPALDKLINDIVNDC
ncbi:PREDICTED: uncharacterized protein LOC109128155, partial [Camelina sativa]|uniref:Uncharacterized protein LOC109128155 n=1 Tax=Camelina sativa TaxID=90675 RepID=A0ABM1QRX5_CAMSA